MKHKHGLINMRIRKYEYALKMTEEVIPKKILNMKQKCLRARPKKKSCRQKNMGGD